MNDIVLRVAAKAVIVNKNGHVLLVREARTYGDGTQTGKYGFPGGRVEPGERFEDGLRREALEEVGLNVTSKRPIYVGEWRPVIKGVEHQIIAVFVVCEADSEDIKLSEEHDDYKWVTKTSYKKLSYMDPDDKVLAEYFSIA